MTVDDFAVTVRRDGDALVVRVVDSPAGTTPEVTTVLADLDRWAALAEPPPAVRDLTPVDATSRDAWAVGTALYRAAFGGPIGDRMRVSRDRSASAGRTLRLVLRLDAASDALPWELLGDPETARFLALEHAVVRYVESADDRRPAIDGPLRLLVAVAAPEGAPPLATDHELASLRTRLQRFTEAGAVELAVLDRASLMALARMLERGPWHVVHYIGHGTVQPDGRGALLLHDGAGGSTLVPGADLGASLAATGDVRLVVLNTCRSAVGDGRDPFAATAPALVRAGVPTVVAMRHVVTDRAAVDLADALYAALVAGATVEGAVTSARRVLHGSRSAGAEWATPALYTRVGRPATIVPHEDDDVRFTIARPPRLRVGRVEPVLVFAHRGGPYIGGRGETIDPQRQVAARIQTLLGDEASTARQTTVTSAGGIPRGTDLVVDVDVPGVEHVVFGSPVRWTGDVAEVLVQLRAPPRLLGTAVDGWLRVFSGPVLVAEAPIGFDVVADGTPTEVHRTPEPMRRFRRIFPCFSPADVAIVQGLAAYAEANGDEFVRGVIDHDATAPDDWMLAAIADADVFQLFWSASSMTSARCRRQWEAALHRAQPDFVRPLYWERPMPQTPELPPPALRALRFVCVPAPTAPPPAAPVGPPMAPPPTAGVPPPPAGGSAGGSRPDSGDASAAAPRRSPPPPARRPGAWRTALAASAVVIGGFLGLMTGAQSTPTSNEIAPGPAGTNWLPGLLVGAAAGLVVALLVLLVRPRRRG